ncbi:coiled-coil domain-containing protein 148-like [Polymixia lowei]
MKDGLGSSKYKPADYERLQAMVEAKRQESEAIGQKVQRTLLAARATKEQSLLRQHRQVWGAEFSRLAKAEETAESDLQDFLRQIRPTSRADTCIFSLQDDAFTLEREREAFRIATVEPVLQLGDDLRFRLDEVRHQQLIPHPSDWERVLQQVNFVKDQQQDISEKLHAGYLALEEEIAALSLDDYFPSTTGSLANAEKIPAEVLDSDCPYPELRDCLVQAFHSLSDRYQSRLQSLQDRIQGTDRLCGWCADDHLCFQLTVGQYAQDMPSRRALYVDMLQRLFPHKTRQELTEHERVWDWLRFTEAQMRAVAQSWQRDRDELLARALVTLEEARHAHREELELHRDRQQQRDVCSRLRDKLQQWRAQQEDVARLEAAIAARRQEEEEERLKKEQEKDAAIRSQQKEKVRQFYVKQRKRGEALERRDEERLSQLRSVMEEQARRDKERVQYREAVLQRRREDSEARDLELQREEEQRQKRLEALRHQVAVVAEADPERMMGDTEAWRSRQQNEEEFVLQKPLYNINTYTDTQIVSDPRVRVEQGLREAGLHHTQYAKEVLSAIKPLKPPRRDTESVVLKS